MPSVLERVRIGEEDPPCQTCGGILKSDTISFGQPLIPQVIDSAMRAAAEADLLLAVGSTLQVYPIAAVVPGAKSAGASLIILNRDPTPYDEIADVTIRGSISDVLPALIGAF
jgi:NAD-dependent deacetylase